MLWVSLSSFDSEKKDVSMVDLVDFVSEGTFVDSVEGDSEIIITEQYYEAIEPKYFPKKKLQKMLRIQNAGVLFIEENN